MVNAYQTSNQNTAPPITYNQSNEALLPISTLWIEGKLSYIEHICLKSMMNCGHPVTLYTYGEVTNIPDGVTVKDASEILDRSRLLKHKKSGSYSLGSNIFRYELLRKKNTIWLDTDIYCLKPIPNYDGYVFGWESNEIINGAVLGLPSDSEILIELEKYYTAKVFIPPWWSLRRKIHNRLRGLIGLDKKAADVGWGVLGPKAITYFAKHTECQHHAQKPEIFYPIHLDDIEEIFIPNANVERFIKEDTVTIHLWNEAIKHKKHTEPDKDSFAYKLCREQDYSF